MCVVSNGYGGLGTGMVCMRDKAKGVGDISRDARAFPVCEVIH